MAIYHLSVQTISRGKGKSCVASAAYRAGEKLYDEKQQLSHNYTKKKEIESEIIAPSNAPEWVYNRQKLWNEVDKSETRCNSRTAREINVALPLELSKNQQKELARNFVKESFVEKGMVADLCFHFNDSNNPHFHVMLTTREISQDGFTVKNRAWDKKELVEEWREQWANHANKALEKAGVAERIDHRSYKEQGVDQLPTIHLGKTSSEMQKKGLTNPRVEINEQIKTVNKEKVITLQEYKKLKIQLEKQKEQQQQDKYKYLKADEKGAVMSVEKALGDKFSYKTVQAIYQQTKAKIHDIGLKRQEIDFKAHKLSNDVNVIRNCLNTIENAKLAIKELSKGLFASRINKDDIVMQKAYIQQNTEKLKSRGISSIDGAKVQLRIKTNKLEQLNKARADLINSSKPYENNLEPLARCIKALDKQYKMFDLEDKITGTISYNELKECGSKLSYKEISFSDYERLMRNKLKFTAMLADKGNISIAFEEKNKSAITRLLSDRAMQR